MKKLFLALGLVAFLVASCCNSGDNGKKEESCCKEKQQCEQKHECKDHQGECKKAEGCCKDNA